MSDSLQRCVNMLKENDDEVRIGAEKTLLTLCRNILSSPENVEYREVRLDDPAVVDKLLPAAGAMECLLDIGFIEASNSFVLPQEESLSKVSALEKLLTDAHISRLYIEDAPQRPHTQTGKKLCRKNFMTSIKDHFNSILRYEDPALQQKARNLIPLSEFEVTVISKIRELQKNIKLNLDKPMDANSEEIKETEINFKDLLLVELLHWYKHKFFTWVDSPKCSACLGECEYKSVVSSKDPKCSRIELHRCKNCKALVKFPRYCDPEPLLSLRRGRCGEWANVFTLMCRSLDYDARLVHDETDHLWTEVWSMTEKRWIHVDPCENVIDQPLMYERGWHKKLTYIIAYSKDEVQDVTWRYTRDQNAVMKRRTLCSESNLLLFIDWLTNQRQNDPQYSAARRKYLTKRRLLELVEFLHMPNQENDDNGKTYGSRTTGSYAWRLARGEISEDNTCKNYVWNISPYQNTFRLQFYIVNDVYKIVGDNGSILEKKSGWQNGVNAIEGGMFRKVEQDWKTAYLARSPNFTIGLVSWSFEVTKPTMCISSFTLRAVIETFHNGNIAWKVEGFFDKKKKDSKTVNLTIDDCSNYYTDKLTGAIKLVLTATVSGGQGDTAWQHAQLFRQSLTSEEHSLEVIIGQRER